MSGELAPRSPRELQAAQRAVAFERQLDELDAAVDKLTEREKLLIEYAWEAGASATREAIAERLHSPHAVTLDARTVHAAIAAVSSPRVADEWWRSVGGHYEERVHRLVRAVDRELASRPDNRPREVSVFAPTR